MTRGARVSAAGAVFRGSLAQQKARTALAVIAIALGVALGYAVQLINQAAINELALGVQTLSGDADLEVRGPRAGFDEALYPMRGAMARGRRGESGGRGRCAACGTRGDVANRRAGHLQGRGDPARPDPHRHRGSRLRHPAAGCAVSLAGGGTRPRRQSGRRRRRAGRACRGAVARDRPSRGRRPATLRRDGHRRRAAGVRSPGTNHPARPAARAGHRPCGIRRATAAGAAARTRGGAPRSDGGGGGQPVAFVSRQPERAGAGRVVHRRAARLLDPGAGGGPPAGAVRAAARARHDPPASHRADRRRGGAGRRGRRRARRGRGLRAGGCRGALGRRRSGLRLLSRRGAHDRDRCGLARAVRGARHRRGNPRQSRAGARNGARRTGGRAQGRRRATPVRAPASRVARRAAHRDRRRWRRCCRRWRACPCSVTWRSRCCCSGRSR